MASVINESSDETTICGKRIGPTGYGMMGKQETFLALFYKSLTIGYEGLTSRHEIPFEDATQTLKAALENGANFWNGVSGDFT